VTPHGLTFKEVEVPPREQTRLNHGHGAETENPEKWRGEVEVPREAEGSVFRVTLRSSTKKHPDVNYSSRSKKSNKKKVVVESDSSDATPIPMTLAEGGARAIH
jgi:hypothetical protein